MLLLMNLDGYLCLCYHRYITLSKLHPIFSKIDLLWLYTHAVTRLPRKFTYHRMTNLHYFKPQNPLSRIIRGNSTVVKCTIANSRIMGYDGEKEQWEERRRSLIIFKTIELGF